MIQRTITKDWSNTLRGFAMATVLAAGPMGCASQKMATAVSTESRVVTQGDVIGIRSYREPFNCNWRVTRVDSAGVEVRPNVEIFMSESTGSSVRVPYGEQRRIGEATLNCSISAERGQNSGEARLTVRLTRTSTASQ